MQTNRHLGKRMGNVLEVLLVHDLSILPKKKEKSTLELLSTTFFNSRLKFPL